MPLSQSLAQRDKGAQHDEQSRQICWTALWLQVHTGWAGREEQRKGLESSILHGTKLVKAARKEGGVLQGGTWSSVFSFWLCHVYLTTVPLIVSLLFSFSLADNARHVPYHLRVVDFGTSSAKVNMQLQLEALVQWCLHMMSGSLFYFHWLVLLDLILLFNTHINWSLYLGTQWGVPYCQVTL